MKEHQTQIRILIVLVLITGALFFLSSRTKTLKEQSPDKPIEATDFTHLNNKLVQTKTIIDTTSPYLEITATYPVGIVGADAVEKDVRATIADFKSVNDFSKVSADEIAFLGLSEGRQYTLSITYQLYHTKNFLTHRIDIYTDTGGAHGGTEVRTFTYDVSGSPVTFIQLLQEKQLTAFATFIQKKLQSDPVIADRVMVDWLPEGASANPDNFSAFAFDDGTLRIIFQQYQIGPYVSGIIEFPIPFKELEAFLQSRYIGE